MELRDLATQAAQVAVEAGRFAMQDQTNPHDLKPVRRAEPGHFPTSEVDARLIRYCRDRLERIDPLNGFWGKQNGEHRPGDRYWCVGRIDGVINFLRNMAEWTVTISMFEISPAGEPAPILGVVHAPVLGLTYLAARGRGAIRVRRTSVGMKREKIMPSTTATLDGSVVSFGMPYFPKESLRVFRTVTAIAGRPADIKRVGPTSLDLCKVADGTYDAYFEPMLHSWDIPAVSAGSVVVWEAQGSLQQSNGDSIHWDRSNDIVASNGLILKDLRKYLT